ncbi:hypothetical protein M9H77_30236 [Catharanthus roseus]|uniref:Uncharacterized protein n=1 Tax=Catharanthus roseus TaxID=4058 RepID=A0ACB9ZX12_CATRO|nr:hypothetical protein M9H77_30236 [Catharanthus roseus]
MARVDRTIFKCLTKGWNIQGYDSRTEAQISAATSAYSIVDSFLLIEYFLVIHIKWKTRAKTIRHPNIIHAKSFPITCSDCFQFRWRIHAVPRFFFFENTLSLLVVGNLDIKVLSVDTYHVHHFIDELSPIVVVPHLPIESSINQSMEDIDNGVEEGSEGEHNFKGKGTSGSDVEVVGVTLALD